MNIAIIGVGAMGGAIASGLIDKGIRPDCLYLSNPSQAKLAPFKALGANIASDNSMAAAKAELVIVAVKPWLVEGVIREISPVVDYQRQAIAVVAAGVPSSKLQEWALKDGTTPSMAIVMPNTAVSVGRSMTFVVPVECRQSWIDPIVEVFNNLGVTEVIDEKHLDAATRLASCGIAYALRYVRAATEGGVELGFKASEAQNIVAQTLIGAATLLQTTGSHAETEIDKVTTPGGMTIRGLNAMEREGFTNSVIAGLKS